MVKPTLLGRWRARRARRHQGETPIDGLTRSFRWLALGACLVVCLLLVGGYVVYDLEEDDDKQEEAERMERAVEACFNYNRDQTNDRESFIGFVPALGTLFGMTYQDIVDRVGQPAIDRYNKDVTEKNPYRQCSRECVVAETTPGAKKCEPAINQEGDPPDAQT